MSARFRVLLTDSPYADADLERSILGPEVEIDHFRDGGPPPPDEAWRSADGIVLFRLFCRRERVALLDRCKAIVRLGVGFDRVDLDACRERGIVVSNVPDYGTTEVADHAIGLLLALRRAIAGHHDALRADLTGNWNSMSAMLQRRMGAQTLALVGLGRIGTATALRAKAFGMRVVFFDPFVARGAGLALGIERADTLASCLDGADALTLHAPLTKETPGMIGAAELALLAPGAVVVNTARGTLLDLDALHAALRSGRLGGAGLDVLPEEPAKPDHPLLRAYVAREDWLRGRMIVTPHAAFFSPEAWADMRRLGTETLRMFLFEGHTRNVVSGQA